jgi:hypothetical protein
MTEDEIADEYIAAADEWDEHHRVLSWHDTKHPAFRRIIALGDAAIPLILEDINNEPNWIVIALRELVPDGPDISAVSGRLGPICDRWLEWARAKGITW